MSTTPQFRYTGILPGTDEFVRHAGWLNVAERHLFTTVYWPTGPRRELGVVLCAPPFHEYVHTHRTFRHLAEKLARAGFPVIRFDYFALGNSSGDLFEPNVVETWAQDIVAQVRLLESLPGVSRVGLFGFRFGATLAASVAEREGVSALAVWNPIGNGKTYARELQALAKFSEVSPEPDQTFLECAGFVVTPETLDAIKRTRASTIPNGTRGLVAYEGDQSDVAGWAPPGSTVDFVRGEGASGALEEPHRNVVPHAVLDRVVEWFGSGDYEHRAPASLDTGALAAAWTLPGGARESLVLSNTGIVGVLTAPPTPRPGVPAVIMSNAGSVHLPGPNQVSVELTRFMADEGVTSLRVDLSNLGESCVGSPEQENVTYPDHGIDEVLGVVDASASLLPGKQFVLSGLCSGAYHAFQGTIHGRNSLLIGAILINPLTFYWEKGANILPAQELETVGQEQYYAQSVRDPERWKKLLSGQVDMVRLAGFVRRAVVRKSKNVTQKVLERAGVLEKTRLAKDIENVLAAGRFLRFVFADTDQGFKLLTHQGGNTVEALLESERLPVSLITRADHTFAHFKSRQQMFATVCSHLPGYSDQR